MKKRFKLFCLLLACSCAWNQEEVKKYKKQSDLAGQFTLSQKQAEKFVEEDLKPVSKISNKKTQVKNKKAKKARTPRKIANKKAPVSPKKKNLPADYPKKFLKYDASSAKTWTQFKPIYMPGEVMIMDVKYLGITTGKVIIRTMPETSIGEKEVYHYNANMKSAPFYRAIYSLDDHIDTYVSKLNFTPVKYSLIQRESGQEVDDLQLFDHDERKTYFWYKRLKKGETKKVEKSSFLPQHFQDSFSALFFVRGLPLKKGDIYKFPVITRTKLWELQAEVMGPDKITVNKKKYDAIKLKIETKFPGVLKKKGDINFWYSADKSRKLLKFNANVKIGNVIGDLADYYFER